MFFFCLRPSGRALNLALPDHQERGRSNTLPSGKVGSRHRHCITLMGGPKTSHAGARRIATAPANKQACNSCSTGIGGWHTQAAGREDERRNSAKAGKQAPTHSFFHTGQNPQQKRKRAHHKARETRSVFPSLAITCAATRGCTLCMSGGSAL